jgi:hypothetical protein
MYRVATYLGHVTYVDGVLCYLWKEHILEDGSKEYIYSF